MFNEFSNNESVKTISLTNQDIVNGVVITRASVARRTVIGFSNS